jgi:hypothetical protein
MELDGPTIVGSVLLKQGLADGVAHRRLSARIRAHLAPQDTDRIVALLAGSAEPSLEGGDAEAHGLTGRWMLPRPRGELDELTPQLTLRRRRRQQLSHNRKAQMRPALVNPWISSLAHPGAPSKCGSADRKTRFDP